MKQWLGPQIKRPFIVIIGIIRITILRYMIHIIILIVITETYETVVGPRNKNTLHLSYIWKRNSSLILSSSSPFLLSYDGIDAEDVKKMVDVAMMFEMVWWWRYEAMMLDKMLRIICNYNGKDLWSWCLKWYAAMMVLMVGSWQGSVSWSQRKQGSEVSARATTSHCLSSPSPS